MKNQISKQVGLAVREFRNSLGMSQENLAFKCELHRTYIGNIERGEYNVTILNLVKIARALDTSAYEILKKANL